MERPSESIFAGLPVPDLRTETAAICMTSGCPHVEQHLDGYCHWLLLWTIPPGVALTAAYWPFFTRLEAYKISTMMVMAILGTMLWLSSPFSATADSARRWRPMPEVFVFATHAYNTSLIYVMLTKKLVLPVYLARRMSALASRLGTLVIASLLGLEALRLHIGGEPTHLSLILVSACPILMLQWTLCSRFLLALPRRIICLAIGVPSIYMTMANTSYVRRDTSATPEKQQQLQPPTMGPREIEKTLLFWFINTTMIFGLVMLDRAVAIFEYHVARESKSPSLFRLVREYVGDPGISLSGNVFLHGLSEAVKTVSQKSQSMYMGSAMFQGGLRMDLLLLYYFCRVMDDLVDEAPNHEAAELAIRRCSWALRCRFGEPGASSRVTPKESGQSETSRTQGEPDLPSSSAALIRSIRLLPATRLTLGPLLGLVDGFRTDLAFTAKDYAPPIATEEDLERYAYNVAGVVALSIVQLIFSYHPSSRYSADQRARILKAAERMGQALQYVNMARDIERDAAMGRIYLPLTWLGEEELKAADVIAAPQDLRVTKLRIRLLDMADEMYESSRSAMDQLPPQVRASVRAVVESYMAIGKKVRRGPRMMGKEKLKLPMWKRVWVVWRAMRKT